MNRLFVIVLVFASLCFQAVPSAFAVEKPTFEEKAGEALGATLVAYAVDLTVGLSVLADSYEEEALEDDRVLQIIALNVQMLDQIGPMVVELSKYDECEKGARDCFETLARSLKSIKTACKQLESYVNTGDESQLAAFEKSRTKITKELDKLSK